MQNQNISNEKGSLESLPFEPQEIISHLRKLLPEIKDRYRIDKIQLFGSFVQGEERSSSDLDLLVEFEETPSLLRFIELENFLTEQLGVKVDLVMKDALKPAIGARILKEAVTL